jgi:hypothetical protein
VHGLSEGQHQRSERNKLHRSGDMASPSRAIRCNGLEQFEIREPHCVFRSALLKQGIDDAEDNDDEKQKQSPWA